MPVREAGRVLALAIAALPCPALAQWRGISTVEAAPPGQTYDYTVDVPNTYDYRYNPEVREDRILRARQAVRPFCSGIQIVGDAKFKTGIFGLTTGKPVYVVYVKCQGRRSHAPG